jgi:mRNA-degrading endonuclease RelE of RelBE toxin-antitoxin system
LNRKIEYSVTLEKKLRKYKGNKSVIEGFKKKAKELTKFEDPSRYGKPLHGSWKEFQEEH